MASLKVISMWLSTIVLLLVFQSATSAQNTQEVALNTVEYDGKMWSYFTSISAGFSVQLPGKPRETTTSVATGIGNISLHRFMLGVTFKSSFGLCLLAYSDFPFEVTEKETVRRVLDGGRDEVL